MTNFYQTDEEIEELVQGFRERTLDKTKWTHIAHLTTGIWHAKNFNMEEATCRIKSGIVSYNLATGGENTGTGGYHETMTIFWMDVIHLFVTANSHLSLKNTCNKFLESSLADKALPFEFYNRDTILSAKARARYLQPDKKEITTESVLSLFPLSSAQG